MKQNETVFLTGFSGSGKTTLGLLLAERLNARFYDTDEIIALKEKKTVLEIFSVEGQDYFRERESDIIDELIKKNGVKIIALGGGALLNKSNRDLIFGNGTVVYLRCSTGEIYERLQDSKNRPLINFDGADKEQSLEQIKELLEEREPHYKMAHHEVVTSDKTIAQALKELLKVVNNAGN